MALASSRAGLDVNRRAFLLGGTAAVVAAVAPIAVAAPVVGGVHVGHGITRAEVLAMYGRNYFDVIAEMDEANLMAVRLSVAMNAFIKGPNEKP